MNIQVTFSQQEIDDIINAEYDCEHAALRKAATEYQVVLNDIKQREQEREQARIKWLIQS